MSAYVGMAQHKEAYIWRGYTHIKFHPTPLLSTRTSLCWHGPCAHAMSKQITNLLMWKNKWRIRTKCKLFNLVSHAITFSISKVQVRHMG